MHTNNSLHTQESKHVYKHFRGKWKELGSDNKSLPRIDEAEYIVKDLESKSIIELEELIIRQEKLLQNKLFLSKLKDKGARIKKKYEDLQTALKFAKEQNDSKNLGINHFQHHEDIDSIEWNGFNKSSDTLKNNTNNNSAENHAEDGGDEEINPLQLLARHSVDYPCRIHERRDEDCSKLIAKELEKLNIEDSKTSPENNLTEGSIDLSNYFGQKLLNTLKEKEKSNKMRELFKPNRSRNSNMTQNKIMKTVPLEESLKLLSEANKKEQMKTYLDTTESLKNSKAIGMTLPSTNYLNYRDTNNEQHILDDNDDDDEETSQFLYFGKVTEED